MQTLLQIAAFCRTAPNQITLYVSISAWQCAHYQLSGVEGHILDAAAPARRSSNPGLRYVPPYGHALSPRRRPGYLMKLATGRTPSSSARRLPGSLVGVVTSALLIQDAAQAFPPAQDLECFTDVPCGHGCTGGLEHLFKQLAEKSAPACSSARYRFSM